MSVTAIDAHPAGQGVFFVDEADAAAIFGREALRIAAEDARVAAVGGRKPSRMRNSVDLPAPLAPTIAWMRPRGMRRSRWSSASLRP
jgi:hypothetical protein